MHGHAVGGEGEVTAVGDAATEAVVVAGGGVGGLTLARALSLSGAGRSGPGRSKLACTVLERTSRADDRTGGGAGVQLAPNATRLLLRLGLGPALAATAVRPERRELRRGDDDRLLAATPLGQEAQQRYGAPYLTVHRADLHAALADLVGPGVVRHDQRVVGLREGPDGVDLELTGGQRLSAAVVVGADGVGSGVRPLVAPTGLPPAGPAPVVVRGLLPARDLPVALRTPAVRVWVGRAQHCVAYPVSGGELVSVAAVVPAGHEDGADDLLAATVLAAFRGWSPTLLRVLAATRFLGRWPLRSTGPLPRWTTRRLALLGDAAHPVLPFLAQGANLAVEDAVVLAGVLADAAGRRPADLAAALARYEGLRRPRATAVQAASRAPVAGADLSWIYGFDAAAALRDPDPTHDPAPPPSTDGGAHERRRERVS